MNQLGIGTHHNTVLLGQTHDIMKSVRETQGSCCVADAGHTQITSSVVVIVYYNLLVLVLISSWFELFQGRDCYVFHAPLSGDVCNSCVD